ncbi:MAG: hypothetical protein DME43_03755 [Verrucomicrobia bacterium]|nr:MAG: hypothetical protein DME43_03755 [Verrucomicrobiota bacterium]PYK73647.1 MAG: hypothetical protein DME44_00630 [Verrucomicrobiota bacterium]
MSALKFQDQCRLGNPGRARVSRVGFAVSLKQSFKKSSRKRDAFASTRDAYTTRAICDAHGRFS